MIYPLFIEKMIKDTEAESAMWLSLQKQSTDSKQHDDFHWMWMHTEHYKQKLEYMLRMAKEQPAVKPAEEKKAHEVKIDLIQGDPAADGTNNRLVALPDVSSKMEVQVTSGLTGVTGILNTGDDGRLRLPYGDSFVIKYEIKK